MTTFVEQLSAFYHSLPVVEEKKRKRKERLQNSA
jgi:hypothetical protein